MLSIRNAAGCIFLFAAVACTPPAPDYGGMQPLGKGIPNHISMSGLGAFPVPPTLRRDSSLSGEHEFKTRLWVNLAGKVTKTVYIEGSKPFWRAYYESMMQFTFTVGPEVLPGPWELDIKIKWGAPDWSESPMSPEMVEHFKNHPVPKKTLSITPISYRTAVK